MSQRRTRRRPRGWRQQEAATCGAGGAALPGAWCRGPRGMLWPQCRDRGGMSSAFPVALPPWSEPSRSWGPQAWDPQPTGVICRFAARNTTMGINQGHVVRGRTHLSLQETAGASLHPTVAGTAGCLCVCLWVGTRIHVVRVPVWGARVSRGRPPEHPANGRTRRDLVPPRLHRDGAMTQDADPVFPFEQVSKSH